MKKFFLISVITLTVTTGGAFAQMGGGQHMMGTPQQPQAQAQAQQGAQPYYGMMGYGMHPGMMTGYGMYPGIIGGYGMQQPMMGYGMGHMYPGMIGHGMPHMFPGAGGDVEKQRQFLKETSKTLKKLHDLMFDYMEAQWNTETKPEQLEKLGREMQGLQQELFEKSREVLK